MVPGEEAKGRKSIFTLTSPGAIIFDEISKKGVLIYKLQKNTFECSGFGPTYTKIGTIQRRLAWPLRKDDTQNREAFQTFTFC